MKALDRIVFFLAAIGLLFFSCLLILFALNLMPWSAVTNAVGIFYGLVAGREELGVIGLLLFLAGVRLGQLSLGQKDKKGIVVQETSLGKVKVSLTAVENLVRKLLNPLSEIREVKPSIRGARGKTSITLRIAIIPETNLPQLTERIQTLVKEEVWDILGIEISEVKVLVDNMAAQTGRVE